MYTCTYMYLVISCNLHDLAEEYTKVDKEVLGQSIPALNCSKATVIQIFVALHVLLYYMQLS